MQVNINEKNIDVVIEYKNNKNLYIRVKEGKFYVTCNRLISHQQIFNIIEKNKKSLAKMYEKQTKKDDSNVFHYYLGNPYTVTYHDDFKDTKIEGDIIFTRDEKMLKKFYQNECIRVFQSRINACIPLFPHLPEFRLRIRKMKTRWGVNNRKSKTITLNSELIKKDISLIDYVVIHELCHFLEPNHSIYFWNEVKKRYPNYKEARKLLNES